MDGAGLGVTFRGPERRERDRDRECDQRDADQVCEVVAAVERARRRRAAGLQMVVRSVASAVSTARPTAPPRCIELLTSPEASPASAGAVPDIASIASDGKPSPAPSPKSNMGGSRSMTYVPSTGVRAKSASAAAIASIARTTIARGPKRDVSCAVKRKESVAITSAIGRYARPTWSGS